MLTLAAVPAVASQVADPKTDFVQALARFSLGLEGTYARLDRNDEARAEFEVVLMLNPNHADAHAALAQVHLRDGQ